MKTTPTFALASVARGSLTLALLGAALAFGSGCHQKPSAATIDLHSPRAARLLGAARAVDTVEVWMDKHPEKKIAFVGELQAHASTSPVSIRKMQETAAVFGLDGIYWIDCASACSGACKAKGFVYLDQPVAVAQKETLFAKEGR